MAWGNFGARPNPPKRGSNCVRTLLTAPSRIAGDGSPVPSAWLPTSSIRPMESCSLSACSSSSSRRSLHALSTASIRRTNPVIPCRSSFGKYVPPKNGRPSGARNTVIGQPPRPVIAWTACM